MLFFFAFSLVLCSPVRKPLHDHREYRYLELANGMKVLLISDSRCDEASSSIRVAVGSASDPANLPGLAHFTEHMLFQGSQKYHGSHDFFDFVHEHGGVSNAFTSKYSTVFSFSIAPAYLDEALQRMADAFTNPLFKEAQFSKEVDAVHSEFIVDLTDDSHRIHHLIRQVTNKQTAREALLHVKNAHEEKDREPLGWEESSIFPLQNERERETANELNEWIQTP